MHSRTRGEKMTKGIFVVIEAGEGAGKSTVASIVAKRLRNEGMTVLCTREPGGTDLGVKIRSLLLHEEKMSNMTELLLFLADRAEHVDKEILPALNQGSVVICGRFSMSTTVYQGLRCNAIAERTIGMLNEIATFGLKPDITILLDIDPAIGLARNSKSGKDDKFERETLEFHRKVNARYVELVSKDPNAVIVDASQPLDEVVAQVTGHVMNAFRKGNTERAGFISRLKYALDKADYSVACDMEACQHYGEPMGLFGAFRCWFQGFAEGLLENE